MIDFGDAPVFDASAYPCIMVMQKSNDKGALAALRFMALNWRAGDSISDFVDIFKECAFSMQQSYLVSMGGRLRSP